MNDIQNLLAKLRQQAINERDKGTYFEQLTLTYLQHEPAYKELYATVQTYSDWAQKQQIDRRDTGIDLVARPYNADGFHAIQCKFYAENYTLKKGDIDSFFTESSKKPFTHRLIVTTTSKWSIHAQKALLNQKPPVTRITLDDLAHSQIDWSQYQPDKPPVLKLRKQLREYQQTAVTRVVKGLGVENKGKLIMACGTGKTFTSLRIAEKIAGAGGLVLFLLPSLALLSQTLTEWTQESTMPLRSFAVCSDNDVGKKHINDDFVPTYQYELAYPATTDALSLAQELKKCRDNEHLTVIFSTYHSIEVLSAAQQQFNVPAFNLILCDEAHRTTGAIFIDKEESFFTKVHNNEFIQADKRLYMTATPRIYGNSAKASAEQDNVTLCSMDDPAIYGNNLYTINFSSAVQQGILVDYKVIVLAVDEQYVSERIQQLLAEDNQLKVEDATRIIGCWKALAKHGLSKDLNDDTNPMQRAVAFCQVIERSDKAKTHKVSSKYIARMFQSVVTAYQQNKLTNKSDAGIQLHCQTEHIDGTMNATEKAEKINWLKAQITPNHCRILSNVRCLAEGVDVPALDAVLFLTPRNSQVDVVQSVGRVMRKAPGKKRGYVILPVVIPAGLEPYEALDDNKTYAVVWQVLQALRAHDDRFDATINKLDLVGSIPSNIEVIAISDRLPQSKSASTKKPGKGSYQLATNTDIGSKQSNIQFEIGEIELAIYAKLVKKCGNPHHWEEWARDIATIAQRHIRRITDVLNDPANQQERAIFKNFAQQMRDDLHESISDAQLIEMLAQHLITQPVFNALFANDQFAQANPISQGLHKVLQGLQEQHLEKEADTLNAFYASVQERARGIDTAVGKQRIILELYDKFFRGAFPKLTERLGIVYTPVEIVDFILQSVNHLLQQEFAQTLASQNVHILDPFTGTGTFITRLMQADLLTKEQLAYKYQHELHANEVVLLAYYIATVNIETTYHALVGSDYQPFPGICLADTFALIAKDHVGSDLFADNSMRRQQQNELDIRVIIGNPPYSAGQTSANDNNQNLAYPQLDARIEQTY
ncbi:damage-inducible protein, partial [Achromatium sp. WMS3]